MKFMKSFYLLIALIVITPLVSSAQQVPHYEDVVKEFFSLYKVEYNAELEFAKNKEGWLVIKNNFTDNSSKKQLFWDAKTREYYTIEGFEESGNINDIRAAFTSYLSSNSNIRYSFERCKYFGYIGWAEDIMEEESNKTNLQDIELEGLARAYFTYANGFLWQPQEYNAHKKKYITTDYKTIEDPNHSDLPYFAAIPSQRVDYALTYFDSSLFIWNKLAAKNPQYETLIGNVLLKIFNDQMYTYFILMVSNRVDEARSVLKKIKSDISIETIAKKYLDACPQNAILFTYSDNDTYPLWYLQEEKNYRKDVTVINISLLGIPYYIDLIKRSKKVDFLASSEFYGSKETAYLVFNEIENINSERAVSLTNFLTTCYNRKYSTKTDNGELQINYPHKQTTLVVNSSTFSKISNQDGLTDFFNFQNGEYLLINDLIMLDIVQQNINTRPITFTTIEPKFENYLQENGINFQLLPIKENDEVSNKTTIESIEKNININIQAIAFNLKGAIKTSTIYGEDFIIGQYNKLIKYYLSIDEKETALKKAREAIDLSEKININPYQDIIEFADLLGKLNQKEAAARILHRLSSSVVDAWVYPSSLKVDMTPNYADLIFYQIKKIINEYNLPKISLYKPQ